MNVTIVTVAISVRNNLIIVIQKFFCNLQSDEVNMRSSSDQGFADFTVDSPMYDQDMQSSDEDIDNYLVNIFDD